MDLINVFSCSVVTKLCVCVCVLVVLPRVPATLSAEYPACDSSHWAVQLFARSISAKGKKKKSHCSIFDTSWDFSLEGNY